MRCKACDTVLNEFELTRKDSSTGYHLDLCGDCYMSSTKAVTDWQTSVDTSLDFGSDDVYDLPSENLNRYEEDF